MSLQAQGNALAGQPANLPAYPAYALMVEFMAANGLRASETADLEVGNLVHSPARAGASPRMAVKVSRTKEHKSGEWVTGTLKSNKSRRTVPLPGWLVKRMDDYLAEHPRGTDNTAPLWPGRSAAVVAHVGKGGRTPIIGTSRWTCRRFYRRVFRPALIAAGLPVSEPARSATKDASARPATRGVRLHDLQHTFAAQQITNGESLGRLATG